MEKLSHYTEDEIKKCEALWERFAPRKSIFDLWSFRAAFYLAYKHQPCFIVLQEGKEDVGLLPLWYEKEKDRYFWFGGWWQEDNDFWVNDRSLVPELLALCPKRACLNSLPAAAIPSQMAGSFQPDDPKYVLDIRETKTFDEYLAGLKKERRKSIKKSLFAIENQGPRVVFNDFKNFDDLVSLSVKRFKNVKEDKNDFWYDPAWEDPRRVEAIRNTIKLAGKNYQIKMLTVMLDGKIAGVDLVAVFNDCYYALAGGYDLENFPGIGNYCNMLNIKDALSLGLSKVDVLQSDCGWKHRWYQEVPLWYFFKE